MIEFHLFGERQEKHFDAGIKGKQLVFVKGLLQGRSNHCKFYQPYVIQCNTILHLNIDIGN